MPRWLKPNRGVVIFSVALGVATLAVGWRFWVPPSSPDGIYDGYSFFGHHTDDLLRFKDGEVTWLTCCGNEDYGTYSQKENGTWVWDLRFVDSTLPRHRGTDSWGAGEGRSVTLTSKRFGLALETENRRLRLAFIPEQIDRRLVPQRIRLLVD